MSTFRSGSGHPRARGAEDLQQFIEAHHIAAVILPLNRHTTTVAEAAAALGVEPGRIVKSLVFLAGEEPILVVTSGLARVERRKLAAALGMGRRQVKFASPEQALEVTGYVVGSMPPFGHRRRLRTLVDAAVGRLDVVYGGGGGVDAMMRVLPAELLRVTGAEVLDLSE
jgi:prolyl-tRNA editing enzyme YbaK/EbsC (Cys-tRNA(Pro) deacylase)